MLNTKQLKCIELMVHTDLQKQQIAEQLKMNKCSISRWMNLEEFQEELDREMHKSFKELAVKAQRKLGKLIDSPNDGVALGACKEALNKGGFKETEKIEAEVNTDINIVIDE